MDEEDLAGAALALDKALEIYPAYARAFLLRGRILEKQGKPREAAGSYEKAIEEDANAYPAYAALAEIRRLEADPTALREIADRWKKAQPLTAAPYYYGALASFQAGQFLVAVDEALMARRFPHENVPHLSLLLANCYIKLRDPSAAAAQMREFLASRPDDPMAPEVRRSLAALEKTIHP
jgi:tetratricopeptide (TPR) repeat protein